MSNLQVSILYLFKDKENASVVQTCIKKPWHFVSVSYSDFDLNTLDFNPSLVILDFLESETDALLELLLQTLPLASYLLVLGDEPFPDEVGSVLSRGSSEWNFIRRRATKSEWQIRIDVLLTKWFRQVNPHKLDFDPDASILATMEPICRLVEQGEWLCIWTSRNGWTDRNSFSSARLIKQFPNTKTGFSNAIADLERTGKLFNLEVTISNFGSSKYEND